MSTPEISVVIPVYNTGKVLQETIDSVLNQTFRNFEIIIIDDGSKDAVTLNILDRQNDHRIRIIRQNNSGVAIARNRGIAESCGEFIAFLDHDDLFLPEKLAVFKEAMDSNPDYAVIYSTITPFGEFSSEASDLPMPDNTDFSALLKHNLIYSMSCIMTRRAFIEKHNISFDPECVPCDDWDFHLQCSRHGKICGINYPWTMYRLHENNQSKDQIKMNLAGIKTAQKYRSQLSELSAATKIPRNLLRKASNHALARHHYSITLQYLNQKNIKQSLFNLAKAFFYSPYSTILPCYIWKRITGKK